MHFKFITEHLFTITERYCFINHSVALKRYEEIKTSIEAESTDDLLISF
jgi:hypothetical protein